MVHTGLGKTSLMSFGKALSDPTRQEIMQFCCCNWVSIQQIIERFGLAQSTVSYHLAILRDAGLLLTRREGRTTYYQLNQENIVNCCSNTANTFAPEINRFE
jgi:DNA-binding transcriptional ArsR family regulator